MIISPPASWRIPFRSLGRVLTALSFFTLCAVSAQAQNTFFVATDGDNANSGLSITEPFRTLHHAMSLVQPGDTILLRGGVYREHVTATVNGTLTQPITLSAYSNEIPVIKGSQIVTGWTHHAGAVWKRSDWPHWSQQVFVDGTPLQKIGKTATEAHVTIGLDETDMVPGSFFVSTNTQTLFMWLEDGGLPTNHVIEASANNYKMVMQLGRYYHVKGLHIEHSNVIIQWPGIFLDVGSRMERCVVRYNDVIGVIAAANTIIEDSEISDNGALGIASQAAATNVVIRNNLVLRNNYRGFFSSYIAGGIKVYGTGSFLVENNLVQDNFGHGIWADYCRDASEKIIQGNTIERCRGYPLNPQASPAGIFVEISRNVLVRNNLIDDNEFTGITLAECDDVRVYNNTIVNTRGIAGLQTRILPRWILQDQFAADLPENYEWISFTGNRVANNVFYQNDTEVELSWTTPTANTNIIIADNTTDFNLYYRGGQSPKFRMTATWSNLTDFTLATGLEANSLHIDPRLASPAAHDFRLSYLSPAIDAGTNLLEMVDTIDLDGAPRRQFANIDLGAYEFDGSAEAIAPSLHFITPGGIASYDLTHVEGDNNANVVGTIWADVSENGGPPSTYPVARTSDTAWRLESLTLQPGILYEITVTATNLNGTPASDVLEIERGGIGTGAPFLIITNTPPFDTLNLTYTLNGTNNLHLQGDLRWETRYSGTLVDEGTAPRSGSTWTVTIGGLQPGHSTVIISATNAWGVLATTTTLVHHGETPIHYVSTNSPTPTFPYTTWDTAAHVMMDAVDAASEGDLVLVGPGVYSRGYRNHTFGHARVLLDKGITLESSDGADVTTIWGYKDGGPIDMRGVLMTHSNAILRGFTLENGIALGVFPTQRKHGGGLLALAMKEVSDCIFTGNTALPEGSGGGAMIFSVTGTITRCTFTGNQASRGGGAAIWFGQGTKASRLVAFSNLATVHGGGFIIDNCPSVHHLLAYENEAGIHGGGFAIANNSILWNSVAESNVAGEDGGGFHLLANVARLHNILAWTNQPNAVSIASNEIPHHLSFSLLGGVLPTSLVINTHYNTDPLYLDAASGNFRLNPASPAVDAGTTTNWLVPTLDLDGNPRWAGPAIDLGGYEAWQRVWVDASAPGYIAGSSVWVNVSLTWPPLRTVSNYTLTIRLPEDWSLDDVASDVPASLVSPSTIAIHASMTSMPVTLDLLVSAPAGTTGQQTLIFDHQFQVTDMPELAFAADVDTLIIDRYKWLNLSPSGDGYVSMESGWIAPGEPITLIGQAEPGWRLRGWIGDTANAVTNAGLSLTVTMDQDRTILADFVKLVTVIVSADVNTVTPSPGTYVVDQGTRLPFFGTAVVTNPASGETSMSVHWEGSGSIPTYGTDRIVSVPILEDSTIHWTFHPIQATQTANGYRTLGQRVAHVTVVGTFPPTSAVHQVWCRPRLNSGVTILQAWGDPTPQLLTNNTVVLQSGLDQGETIFNLEIRMPAEHDGPFPLEMDVGLNALPGTVLSLP